MSDAEKNEVARIRARLGSLNAERAALEERLAAFERRRETPIGVDSPPAQAGDPPTITSSSPTAEKVAFFRRLFAGRPDIFPVRWENQKGANPAMPRPAPTNGPRGYAASPE